MQFDIHTHSIDESSLRILNSGLQIPKVGFFSSGVHPWEAESFDGEKLILLKEIAENQNCVAIGEIGLDKLKGPDLEIQVKAFQEQVKLAEELELPVIIHCVKAWNELREIKREIKPEFPWIFHGFSKASILEEVIDEGMYVSLGSLLLSNSKLGSAVEKLPLNRIFLETDESTSEINEIYQKLSNLKRINLPEIERAIEENVFKIFSKWKTGLKELNY